VPFEQRQHPVERVALGDSAEIDLHSLAREQNGPVRTDLDLVRSHAAAGVGQLGGGGHYIACRGFLPELDQRTDRHIERAPGEIRVGDGKPQNLRDPRVDRLGSAASRAVESTDCAFGPVDRHQTVEFVGHLVEIVQRARCRLRCETVERNFEDGAHCVATVRGGLLGRVWRNTSQRQQCCEKDERRSERQESGASPNSPEVSPS
jgi:hypothetical protein